MAAREHRDVEGLFNIIIYPAKNFVLSKFEIISLKK